MSKVLTQTIYRENDPKKGTIILVFPTGPIPLDNDGSLTVVGSYTVGENGEAPDITLEAKLSRGDSSISAIVTTLQPTPAPAAGETYDLNVATLYPSEEIAGVATLAVTVHSGRNTREGGVLAWPIPAEIEVAAPSSAERHAYLDPDAVHYEVHDFAKGKVIFHFADGTLSHEMTRDQQLRGTLDHPKTVSVERLSEHLALGAQD